MTLFDVILRHLTSNNVILRHLRQMTSIEVKFEVNDLVIEK